MKNTTIVSLVIAFLCIFNYEVYGQMSKESIIDCNINTSVCIKEIPYDKVKVTFDISPKPLEFMKELIFKITLTKDEKPFSDAKIMMDLNMPGMFMGTNRPTIKHIGNGIYEGKGIIPRCPSGKKIWRADIKIEKDNTSSAVSFTFEGK